MLVEKMNTEIKVNRSQFQIRKNECLFGKCCMPSSYEFFKYIHSKQSVWYFPYSKYQENGQREDKELSDLSISSIYFTEQESRKSLC